MGHIGLLRISESTSLRWRDLVFDNFEMARFGKPSKVMVHLEKTKTGAKQSVLISDQRCVFLLWWWRDMSIVEGGMAPDGEASVFGLSSEQFALALSKSLVRCNFARFGFTSHCLRHGGASERRLRGDSVESIMEYGR